MEKKAKSEKLGFITLAGYGSGTAGDSMPFTLFQTYFIFFLTDMAGISPGIAGTISFIAIVCQGITGPVFGYLSDNSTNPNGRRRPFFMKAVIPFGIFIALMFLPINLNGPLQYAFYLVMAAGMMTCYSAFKSSWDALGAELSDDYNERNLIRFSTGAWAYPFNWVAQSFVLIIVAFFAARGAEGMGWFWGAALCGILTIVFGYFAYATTKGKEKMDYLQHIENVRAKKKGIIDLFKGYGRFLKVKAIRILVIFQFTFVIGYTIILNGLAYVLSNNAAMSEGQMATFWTINTIMCIIMLPVITIVATKIDKKVAIAFFIMLNVVVNFAFYFIGVTNMTEALIFSVGGAFTTTAFYGVFYSLLYDCCDIFELVTCERKEGNMMAMAQLAQTLATAVASLLFGWLMQAIRYDGMSIANEAQMQGILTINTLVPGVIMLISVIVLMRYKLTKEKFDAVKGAIEDRKAGKEVDMAQFKDIV